MLLTFENYVSEKESFRPQSEHYSLSKNPSKTSSKFYPYLVDIQSNYISEIDTRIVIPLGRVESFKNQIMKKRLKKYEGSLRMVYYYNKKEQE